MTIKNSTVTVSGTPVLLGEPEEDFGGIQNGYSIEVSIEATETGSIRLGGPDVSPTSGRLVGPGSAFAIDAQPNDQLYAVAVSGTVAVNVFRNGV